MVYALVRNSISPKLTKHVTASIPWFSAICNHSFKLISRYSTYALLGHNYSSSVWYCVSLFFRFSAVHRMLSCLFNNLHSQAIGAIVWSMGLGSTIKVEVYFCIPEIILISKWDKFKVTFFCIIMENFYAWYLCVNLSLIMKTQTCHFPIHILKKSLYNAPLTHFLGFVRSRRYLITGLY